MYHFELGARLGEMGKMEEGFSNARYRHNWIREEALECLEAGRRDLPELTGHLANALGYARMNRDDPAGALEMFILTIQERPDHAFALDNAAHCRFLLCDTKKVRRLAKKAARLGITMTYDAWKRREYRAIRKRKK